ncbi:MAG: hypothetical protein Q8Q08_12905 [Candidatus Omnitrophota bacterium]|nr:hypothetical protein [Candidatus Omnitrophota bacterium]
MKNYRMKVYNRSGAPISTEVFARRMEDKDYKIVKQERLWNGLRVSTVWLGIDHGYGHGRPLIFETMVFPGKSFRDMDMMRYATEAEALAGHARMRRRWIWWPRPVWRALNAWRQR